MTIGERIKKARKEHSLTQQELADRIGNTQNTIARYETNKVAPSSSAVVLLCRELEINENWLRTGEGEMPAPSSRADEIARAVDAMLPGESEEFRRQLAKVLSNLREELWAAFMERMFEILKLHAKQGKPDAPGEQKNAPEVSEAELAAYEKVRAIKERELPIYDYSYLSDDEKILLHEHRVKKDVSMELDAG